MAGDPRFHALLNDIGELHDRKQADYGRTGDPFANVRASEDFGIEGWVGCMMRANDKMRRLQTAAKGSELKNEGIEDSLMDLAVYSLIALVLFREEQEAEDLLDLLVLGREEQEAEEPEGIPDCSHTPEAETPTFEEAKGAALLRGNPVNERAAKEREKFIATGSHTADYDDYGSAPGDMTPDGDMK